jgi:hypothetical protein
MDGRVFDAYPMTQHVACRCVVTPVANSDLIPPSAQQRETGEAWFARQDAETQRKILRSEDRYLAYQNGVSLRDMTTIRRNSVWGDSVAIRPLGSTRGMRQPVSTRDPMPWRPSMSAKDAERWAEGSSIPFETTHVTTRSASDRIRQDGFRLDRSEWGRLYGDGVYMGPDAKTADFYEALFSEGGRPVERLTMRAKTTQTMKVDVQGTETKTEELQKVINQFPGGQRSYENKVVEITERNARITQQLDVEEAAATAKAPANPFAPRAIDDIAEDPFSRTARERELGYVQNPNAHAINEIAEDAGYDSIWINRTAPNMREDGLGGMGPSEIVVFDPRNVVVIKD